MKFLLMEEATEAETMGMLTDQIAERVEEMKHFSITDWAQSYLPIIADDVLRIALAFLIFFVGRKIVNVIVDLCNKSMEKHGVEATVRKFIKNMLSAVGYVIIVMVMCELVGIAVTSIAAAFATVGVAVGLALQGSLSNFAGGVLILLMKPFVVGNYIVAAGVEGVVHEIGIVYTELHTPDNRVIMVPNGTLSAATVVNVSRKATRRVDISVGVSYNSDLQLAKSVLRKVGETDEARLAEEAVTVFVDDLGDSAVKLGLRVWVASADYWTAKWRMTENTKKALDAAGIEIPFNQIDVHMR